jgi:TonB-linked SusC/RagA family outer membrane protein
MKKKRFVALLKTTMRITLFQTIIAVTFTCATLARHVDAQILDKQITLSVNESEVKNVLRQIQKQAHVKFVYSATVIDANRRISVHVSNQKLGEILDEILVPLKIHYRVMQDHIVLFKENQGQEQSLNLPSEESVPDANPQEAFEASNSPVLNISGVVSDEKGESLPGVSVIVKGTTMGTTTDANGMYRLAVTDAQVSGVLVFSFVGYKSTEVNIDNQTTINVQLSLDVTSLNEVVIVAYGEQRKISLVGSQSGVEIGELKQPVANLSTVLAGRIAGVIAVQRSGQPGYDNADIWIRGISTFGNNPSNPLILVDGVARSMNNIDPQDVESFQVLKDASAIAMYGIRGANGVILIKTKTGKEGKPKISFDYNQGITTFTKVPEMTDGVTYMELANEARTTRGQTPIYSQDYINKTKTREDPLVYPNVNWMNEVFNKWGSNKRAGININGGAQHAKYYVSTSYYDETGFFNTDDLSKYNSAIKFTRYNITSNLALDVTSTTKLDLGIQGYSSNGNYPGISAQDIFTQTMMVPPVSYPVMYPGGKIPGRNPNGDQRNPYADVALRGYQTEFRNQLYSNARVTQKLDVLLKGLSASAMFAFDAYNQHQIQRTKREDTWIVDPVQPRNPDGTINLGTSPTFTSTQTFLSYNRINGGNRSTYLEASVNYDNSFGKSRVSGLLLYNQTDRTEAFATDFVGSIPFRTKGLAGRGTYSYDERYFAEINFGYNGSENFAPKNRYGFFPSLGVGWVVSNERFFEPISDAIQFMKIRYSDGIVGSGTGGRRFGYLTIMNTTAPGYTFGLSRTSATGVNVSDYAVDVTWSTSRKQDLGIEINTLREHLNIVVDVFKDYREGIFLQRGRVPNFAGLINQPYGNLGIVKNKGIDGTIQYNGRIGNVNVGFRGNATYTVNEMIENDQPSQLYPWLDLRGKTVLANTRFGYIAEGLFKDQSDIDNHAVQTFGTVMPGDIKYKDLNNDGEINAFDRAQIGHGDVPAFIYGFSLTLAYKGFDFSAFFQGQANADILLSGLSIMPFNGDGGIGNLQTIAKNRWTEENPNPNAFYPRLAYGGAANTNNTQTSSWWVKDIDFLRLKTAELGYTMPQKLSGKIHASNVRFYLRGFNLLTFSKFKLWDPELSTSTNGGGYPNITAYNLGLTAQF